MRVEKGVKILSLYDNPCDHIKDQEYHVTVYKDNKGDIVNIIVGQRIKTRGSSYFCSTDEISKAILIVKLLNGDNT